MYRLLKRFWIPLLLVVVVGIGGYAITQIRSSAAPRPPKLGEGSGVTANVNPKRITYEIVGSGGTANINYLDENGQPHLIENSLLPWSFTIVTTVPSMSANIVAQGDGDVTSLGCRVTVDGETRDDRTSTDKVKPFIYCLVKSV
ncbi:MmpS family transport accessory protein [Mycobacteroides chelonae]|uniref:MmpS family protein n=1 Tax=Mycobacteroides chelonae TaxID=1774 RepID=A0A1S1MBU5_MYCCH|nr:MmpS family transport accessory protein [Mycobacteroides chelonae]OHU45432.1 MmpS family protein [Mycobacteroides chelonae]OHU79395.1 MmpS family protein [Mycobacteroides chelonae]QQG89593.1 MmpS family protein [Mycobacteroides chelonae]QQG94408.1 MmpS family protein [Mycobacteroides chelonae]